MSLRARLALLFFLFTGIGIGLVGLLAFRSTTVELGSETDEFLRRRANEIVDGLRAPPRGHRSNDGSGREGDDDGRRPDTSPVAFDPDAMVQILDVDGVPAASSGSVALPVSETDVRLAEVNDGDGDGKVRSAFQDVVIDGEDHRLYTRTLPAGGAVQVARATSETTRVLDALQTRLLVIALGLAGVAGLVGWGVASRTTKPLRRLSAAAGTVARTGDLDTPIDVDRSDEVGALARSFQEMLEALATSREQQHRLVLDAGHELRTPLTSMRANVALLERADRLEPDERAELLAAVKAELGELNDLFGELIELATDSQNAEPHVHLELRAVVERAAARLERRSGRRIEIHGDGGAVLGDATLLERAVSNLLANAHKFSPSSSPITVVVSDGRVAVRDQGPGIPPTERDRVFDRFFRSETTRSMPGSGLGLAIVAQIVRNHGGHVWATDNPDGPGAEVGFAIPVADPAAPAPLR